VPCDSGDVFHCNDDKGRCIPLSMRCDGREWQCPRNADEKDCSTYICIVLNTINTQTRAFTQCWVVFQLECLDFQVSNIIKFYSSSHR
jgi:hypothetical protein